MQTMMYGAPQAPLVPAPPREFVPDLSFIDRIQVPNTTQSRWRFVALVERHGALRGQVFCDDVLRLEVQAKATSVNLSLPVDRIVFAARLDAEGRLHARVSRDGTHLQELSAEPGESDVEIVETFEVGIR